MPVIVVNQKVTLRPTRRRMVKALIRLFDAAQGSDGLLYAREEMFIPIFPTEDAALTAAVAAVYTQLNALLAP